MATTLEPEMAARIAALAERLGFAGPDATERVIVAALDYLDQSAGKWVRWLRRNRATLRYIVQWRLAALS